MLQGVNRIGMYVSCLDTPVRANYYVALIAPLLLSMPSPPPSIIAPDRTDEETEFGYPPATTTTNRGFADDHVLHFSSTVAPVSSSSAPTVSVFQLLGSSMVIRSFTTDKPTWGFYHPFSLNHLFLPTHPWITNDTITFEVGINVMMGLEDNQSVPLTISAHAKLSGDLKEGLWLNPKFSDVNFICDAQRIPAHWVILTTRSEYFAVLTSLYHRFIFNMLYFFL